MFGIMNSESKTNWILWAFFISIFTIGGFFVFRTGFGSTTTTVIERSEFSNLISAAEHARSFIQELNKNSFLFLIGIEPRDNRDLDMITPFLNPRFSHILIEEGIAWNTTDPRVREVSLQNQTEDIIAFLKQAKSKNESVVYIGPVIFVSQFVSLGPSRKIRESFLPSDIFSLILNNLPKNRAEEKSVRIPCVVSTIDQQGTGILGCFSLQFARQYYGQVFSQSVLIGLQKIDNSNEAILMYQ